MDWGIKKTGKYCLYDIVRVKSPDLLKQEAAKKVV